MRRPSRRTGVAAGTLALLLALQGTATASRSIDATCDIDLPSDRYDDVGSGNVHARAIACLAERNLVEGAGDGGYQPGAFVTRGQLASMLLRMVEAWGSELPVEPEDAFDDDDDSVHEGSIDRLAAIGVVSGTGERSYDPDGEVTRGQLASVLVRAVEQRLSLQLPTKGDTFTDDDGSVHEPSLDKAALAGVVDGHGDGRFDPNGAMRRDHVASFLVRALDLIVTRPGWERAVALIQDCDVASVAQTHSLVVILSLKDGDSHSATAPYIDAVFDEVAEADHCPPLESVAIE